MHPWLRRAVPAASTIALAAGLTLLTLPQPPLLDTVIPAQQRVVDAPPPPTPTPRPTVAPVTPKNPGLVKAHAPVGDVQKLGRKLAAERGWVGAEWNALQQLWGEESGWSTTARNPTSGACGIPQRHPCRGLTADAAGQISWGLDYIAGRYGTPSAALAHKHRRGWY